MFHRTIKSVFRQIIFHFLFLKLQEEVFSFLGVILAFILSDRSKTKNQNFDKLSFQLEQISLTEFLYSRKNRDTDKASVPRSKNCCPKLYLIDLEPLTQTKLNLTTTLVI